MRGSRLSPYVIGKGLLLCASTGGRLFPIPLPALSIVCVMSSFTGRRAEGHGRVIRRLDMKERTAIFCNHAISAVCQA